MPNKALVRIPNSVSRGGTCKTNLRGTPNNSVFDYAVPSRTFNTLGPNLISEAVTGGGTWSNTIKRTFANSVNGGDATITYPSVVSTALSATILIRINISFSDTPLAIQGIFQNGTFASNGYGIVLKYEVTDYNVYFVNLRDSEEIKLNDTALSTDTWYQFSVRFNTVDNVTTLEAYQNGIRRVAEQQLANSLLSATGSTVLLNFYGKVTDFAIIEQQFSNDQLRLYGTAPYI